MRTQKSLQVIILILASYPYSKNNTIQGIFDAVNQCWALFLLTVLKVILITFKSIMNYRGTTLATAWYHVCGEETKTSCERWGFLKQGHNLHLFDTHIDVLIFK